LQTAKNLGNVYDLINQEFLAIQAFVTSARINLESKVVPEGLKENFVKVLVTILKICRIATRYATENRFEKGMVIL